MITEYDRKLRIARMAYREIAPIIEKYEITGFIHLHWDGCITVEDQLFHERQLRQIDQEIE